jgi:DNA-directed RNA polymerase sigma subunit (sigma70/sigma32)
MQDVEYMQQRMLEYDSSLDISDGEHALIDYLPAPSTTEPLKHLLQQVNLKITDIDLPNILQTMAIEKPRLWMIIEQRWLCAENKATMKNLSIQLGVSIERVNQLEKQAMQWLKQKLQANNCLSYDTTQH